MNRFSLIYYKIKSVALYRETAESATVRAMMKMMDAALCKDLNRLAEGWGELNAELYNSGEPDLFSLMLSIMKADSNPFSRACGQKRNAVRLDDEAVKAELSTLLELSRITPQELLETAGAPEELAAALVKWENGGEYIESADMLLNTLRRSYESEGCGIFSRHRAFIWQKGELVPVKNPDKITFSDLKGYELQREQLIDNTLAFLKGLPCNNVLLYGDRGTGKSSSVHALLNEYSFLGLRIIELSKADIGDFHRISSMVAESPLKFIVFIDDLSFTQDNDSFAQLKAALEGGIAARPDNMLIYATTNRRHLIRETFESRQGDELHANDSIQEELSLSDRFGLVITFINPDRKQFYDILDAMALDRGLDIPTERLHYLAERWSLGKGGRSPRGARQFIDSLCSVPEDEEEF